MDGEEGRRNKDQGGQKLWRERYIYTSLESETLSSHFRLALYTARFGGVEVYRGTEKFVEFRKLTHVISRAYTKYAQYIPRCI
jgi:hypothetical protein